MMIVLVVSTGMTGSVRVSEMLAVFSQGLRTPSIPWPGMLTARIAVVEGSAAAVMTSAAVVASAEMVAVAVAASAEAGVEAVAVQAASVAAAVEEVVLWAVAAVEVIHPSRSLLAVF